MCFRNLDLNKAVKNFQGIFKFSITNKICLLTCTLLSRAKDPVPSKQRNNIVYKYDRKDCEAVCFGESKRTIAQRTKELTKAVRAADTRRYGTSCRSLLEIQP